ASGVTAIMTGVISPGEAYLEWGWRVPFLLSIVLIIVGFVIRRAINESPVFAEMASRSKKTRLPIVALFKNHWVPVVLAALVFAGNGVLGYMTMGGFLSNYAVDVQSLGATQVLIAATVAAALWFFSTLGAGYLADAVGRRTTFIIGFAV